MKTLHKKRIALTMLIVLILNLFFLNLSYTVHAADSVMVDKYGRINFTTTSTKATTGIKYKTVGFTITRSTSCSGSQCAPQNGTHGVVRVQQIDEIDNGDGTVTTYFQVPEASVSAALESAGLKDITYGGTIYLSSIFHVVRNNNEDHTDHVDLQSIKNAENWADPNGFRQYYDIPVSYTAKYEVTKIYRTSDGTEIKRGNVDNPNDPDKRWPVGEEINAKLDETVVFNGKTYSLIKSYIQSKHKPNDQDYVQTGTPSSNPKLAQRSFTTYLGGTNVIGVYREGANPVEAIYELEDGTRIKSVDIGEKSIGDPVSHTFEEKVSFQGKQNEIIRSYIIQNEFPNDKKFVQEKGDPNLLTRNTTVGKGGTKFVGVYKPLDGSGGGGGGSCTYEIGAPSKGNILSGSVLDPSANGVLKADDRGSEKFDVSKGIPTSEDLYANVFGKNYLFQNKWANMRGQVTYTVTVKKVYNKTWTIPAVPGNPGTPAKPMSKEVPVQKNVTVIRDYSYWQIDNLEVYKLKNATVKNYALGGYGETVTLNPNGYIAPTLVSDNKTAVEDHVQPQPCNMVDLGTETVSGGSSEPPTPQEDFQPVAEAEVKEVKVKNDHVVFNGTTIMNNAQVEKEAPRPGSIPEPQEIGQNVLYQSGYTVSKTLVNKANQPTTGKIYYDIIPGNINGGSNKEFAINGMNSVTVHTPVVIYAAISDDKAHNQKTVPAPNREATILDRPFTIYMPTSGQHRNILGYGDRDYAKYVRDKQVWFPFDVYSEDKSNFYPKNTWISIPVNQEATTFFMPVWVDEGIHDVLFRTIAENAPPNFTTQPEANLDLAHHVATDVVPVDVIGRVYDFHITDIADFNWESFFRKAKGSSVPTGNSFWVGDKEIDGAARIGANNYILPVRQGSNPLSGLQNIAVKTGYHFSATRY
ncbi:DUF5704 domain-containing protein, partial [Paenibacillus glucanolyticus]